MWITPDVQRQRRLRLEGFERGDTITFCPRCDFQLPPQTVGYPQCPDCGYPGLHMTAVTEELERLIAEPATSVILVDGRRLEPGETIAEAIADHPQYQASVDGINWIDLDDIPDHRIYRHIRKHPG